MADTYRISGMTCSGCVRSVENAIMAAAPQASVRVELEGGRVTVDGADARTVAKAVEEAGFEFLGAA
jgi:copper chaperone